MSKCGTETHPHPHTPLHCISKGLVWLKPPEIHKVGMFSLFSLPGALPRTGSSASQKLLWKVLVLKQPEQQQRSVYRVISLLFSALSSCLQHTGTVNI